MQHNLDPRRPAQLMPAAPPEAPPSTRGVSRPLRWLAALLILVFGVVHLLLFSGEYKDVKVIGALFLVNAAAALLIAIALATRPIGAFALAGIALSLLTLVAFTLSRTTGLFGFVEQDFGASAIVAAAAEAGTIAVLGLWYLATRPKRAATPVVGERDEPTADS